MGGHFILGHTCQSTLHMYSSSLSAGRLYRRCSVLFYKLKLSSGMLYCTLYNSLPVDPINSGSVSFFSDSE